MGLKFFKKNTYKYRMDYLFPIWIIFILTLLGCNNENGRIKPYDENRSYWQYKGKPVYLLGGNKVVNPFQMNQQELKTYLDELNSVGGNYFRNVMSDRETGNVKAFKKSESGKYDLTQWNEAYLMAKEGAMYGLYFPKGSGAIGLDLRNFPGLYQIQWIEIGKGRVAMESEIDGGGIISIAAPYEVDYGWACAITMDN
ncbi:MAG: hypothetical protein WD431_00810 [Cyclobacteriaceae bacterium]